MKNTKQTSLNFTLPSRCPLKAGIPTETVGLMQIEITNLMKI